MSKKDNKKEMPNGIKYGLFAFIVILVISLIGFGAYKVLAPTTEEENKKEKVPNRKEIVGYGIYLRETDSDLYRQEYDILKKNLESNEINYDEYASSVAKLFIIDLYTIKNKINKYDIGGIDFVYPNSLENYKTNVTDTIYKYVEDNSNNNRDQQLPVVSDVLIEETKKEKFLINEDKKEYDAYSFKLKWNYVQDFGYDASGEVKVVNKNDKMYVVEKN